MKLVIASGYFNPLHEGHLKYLQAASKLGDKLIVIVNNDTQVKLKGLPFQDQKARVEIIGALRFVHRALLSVDTSRTVVDSLTRLAERNPKHQLIFATGSDHNQHNTKEYLLCKMLGIKFRGGMGGKKINSSSSLKLANRGQQR